jgi:hypothetical protein
MVGQSRVNSPLARATGRVIGRAIRSHRFVDATIVAVASTTRAVGRVLRALFLELTGLLFLIFTCIGAIAGFREYQAYNAGKIDAGRPLLALLFTIIFAYFALTSFWRSRQGR